MKSLKKYMGFFALFTEASEAPVRIIAKKIDARMEAKDEDLVIMPVKDMVEQVLGGKKKALRTHKVEETSEGLFIVQVAKEM